jgi:hypothetical protein
VTLITRVTVGPYTGQFVHAFPCAHQAYVQFYTAEADCGMVSNSTQPLPLLKFHTPPPELTELADKVSYSARHPCEHVPLYSQYGAVGSRADSRGPLQTGGHLEDGGRRKDGLCGLLHGPLPCAQGPVHLLGPQRRRSRRGPRSRDDNPRGQQLARLREAQPGDEARRHHQLPERREGPDEQVRQDAACARPLPGKDAAPASSRPQGHVHGAASRTAAQDLL